MHPLEPRIKPERNGRGVLAIHRFIIIAAVAAAFVAPAMAAEAAPSAKAAVTMAVAVTSGPVAQGSQIRVSGRVHRGSTGNVGPVDVYLTPRGSGVATRVASTTTSTSGAFHTTMTAAASGTVKVVYLGNPRRSAATRTEPLSVYVNTTTKPATVFVQTGQKASPCMTGKGAPGDHAEDCRYASPVIGIPAAATLHFAWTVTDRKSVTAGMVVGYAKDRGDRREIDPRWWQSPSFVNADLTAGPAIPDCDMTPGTTSGAFLFDAGQYLTWGVTITETHLVRHPV